MKTPPPLEDRVLPAVVQADKDRDHRFLVFAGVVLVAIALGFKSELVAPNQVWGLAAGLAVLAVAAVLGYLTIERRVPPIEHFVPAALGALALAGLALLMPRFWEYALAAAAFGVCFYAAAQLDYRHLLDQSKPGHWIVQEAVMVLAVAACFLVILTATLDLPIRLAGIFAVAASASYRTFRVMGRPMAPRRALLFSVFVGQVVTFCAWAMTANLYIPEGFFAVILLLIWYVNRGFVRHTVDETLTRNVVIEYGIFVLLIAYLFFISRQPAH
ncbi:MAG: hypothetical protein M3024_09215 [Candidatus Dormibacteraeota bacterium]|nr:hypothetical protein [Candidatus Dormibacteraeota bacterium]